MIWLVRAAVLLACAVGLTGCTLGGKRGSGGALGREGQSPADGEPTDGAGGAATVPTNPAELFAFLQAGSYRDYPRQPTVHPPYGPHGIGGIRVYFSPTLSESLAAAGWEHPAGSAAVAEKYDAAGSAVGGWAVSVKMAASSDGGFGWYWYEVDSAVDALAVVDEGLGAGACISCHAGGDDYVMSAPP